MGGKSSSAPAPDPRLADAQIQSLGVQNNAITKMMANSDATLPLQMESMKFGLDTSKTAYDQAQQDRQYALERRGQLTGFQDKAIADAKKYDTQAYQDKQAGIAEGDVQQGLANARGSQQRGLTRIGINPASGRYAAMDNGITVAGAGMQAQAANMARSAARDMGLKYEDRAAGMLSGYPSMGMASTGSGASYGGLGLTYANSGAAGMNQGYAGVGALGGSMGANATSMYGAEANYKNTQDQIAANSNPWNTILGAAAGGAGMYGMSMLMPRRT